MNKLKTKTTIPLTYDFMFKEVFGSQKRIKITTYFIARYLKIDYHKLIGKVILLDKQLTKDNIKDKSQEVDLIVHINDKIINIELNMQKYPYLIARNLAYLCRIYGNQLNHQNDYLDYKKVLQINFDNFSFFKPKKVRREYLLTSKDQDNIIYSKLIEIHHVDMEYCRKICYSENKRSFVEDWVRLLQCNNLKEIKKVAGEIIMNEEVREEFVSEVEKLNMNPRLMGLYYDREHHEKQVLKGVIEIATKKATKKALKEGLQLGIKQGIEQERNQTNLKIAKKMIAEGFDIELIKKFTSLSKKEIKELL